MQESQALDFDANWNRMAKELGFSSNFSNNRLEPQSFDSSY
jgi:hypothetical protein